MSVKHLATVVQIDTEETVRLVLLSAGRRALTHAAEILRQLGTLSDDPQIANVESDLRGLLDDYQLPAVTLKRRPAKSRKQVAGVDFQLPVGDRT